MTTTPFLGSRRSFIYLLAALLCVALKLNYLPSVKDAVSEDAMSQWNKQFCDSNSGCQNVFTHIIIAEYTKQVESIKMRDSSPVAMGEALVMLPVDFPKIMDSKWPSLQQNAAKQGLSVKGLTSQAAQKAESFKYPKPPDIIVNLYGLKQAQSHDKTATILAVIIAALILLAEMVLDANRQMSAGSRDSVHPSRPVSQGATINDIRSDGTMHPDFATKSAAGASSPKPKVSALIERIDGNDSPELATVADKAVSFRHVMTRFVSKNPSSD